MISGRRKSIVVTEHDFRIRADAENCASTAVTRTGDRTRDQVGRLENELRPSDCFFESYFAIGVLKTPTTWICLCGDIFWQQDRTNCTCCYSVLLHLRQKLFPSDCLVHFLHYHFFIPRNIGPGPVFGSVASPRATRGPRLNDAQKIPLDGGAPRGVVGACDSHCSRTHGRPGAPDRRRISWRCQRCTRRLPATRTRTSRVPRCRGRSRSCALATEHAPLECAALAALLRERTFHRALPRHPILRSRPGPR